MRRRLGIVIACSLALLLPQTASGVTPKTRLVSVATSGTVPEDFNSSGASISANGRFIVFVSASNVLSADDLDDTDDVYIRDRVNGTTQLISMNSDEIAGDGNSSGPSISADGRYVAFSSWATNFSPGDLNNAPDVFVRDRQAGVTLRISVSTNGVKGNSYSYDPKISANGRFVVFTTESDNLIPNDNLGFRDVVIHDRVTHTTQRVSLTNTEHEPNADSQDATISADGNLVAFLSGATNMVASGKTGAFVRDRAAGTTRLVSVSTKGVAANAYVDKPVISANGRFVVFGSDAKNLANDGNNLMDIFVRDLKLKRTGLVSRNSNEVQGEAASYVPWISANGRFVVFTSDSTNLVPHDVNGVQEIFIRDRTLGTTRRVSVSSVGQAGDLYSDKAVISGDGRFVAFESLSAFVATDINTFEDIYLRGPLF